MGYDHHRNRCIPHNQIGSPIKNGGAVKQPVVGTRDDKVVLFSFAVVITWSAASPMRTMGSKSHLVFTTAFEIQLHRVSSILYRLSAFGVS